MSEDQSQAQHVFQFDDDSTSFEVMARENGTRTWSARELQRLLGYKSWDSFKKVIDRAMTASLSANIPTAENFTLEKDVTGGTSASDFRLTKFGCYMVAMNGDAKKPEVGLAQAYFAAIAEQFQNYIESAEDVERVVIRRQVSDREKDLSKTAQSHGVTDFALFRNAGYRGLYNMNLNDLKKHKNLPKKGSRTLLDFMGKRELAANLFRITETEAKIENEDIRGQKPLESAAHAVGREVRDMMTKQGGPAPEDLELTSDIRKVGIDLRKTHKQLEKPKD